MITKTACDALDATLPLGTARSFRPLQRAHMRLQNGLHGQALGGHVAKFAQLEAQVLNCIPVRPSLATQGEREREGRAG